MQHNLMLTSVIVSVLVTLYTVSAVYECRAGFYGPQCGNKCGNCLGGGEFCQVHDGLCMNGCASGYHGYWCKYKCTVGMYGPNCREPCGQCKSGSDNCDKVTGQCHDGCKPGYQAPMCDLPCPHMTWGEDCTNTCDCPESCGCHHVTGICNFDLCDKPELTKYLKEHWPVECINQYALTYLKSGYKPRPKLKIPWKPFAVIIGGMFIFVLAYYVWWLNVVRRPAPVEKPVVVDRSKKPEHLNNPDEPFVVLAREKRRMRSVDYRLDHRENQPPGTPRRTRLLTVASLRASKIDPYRLLMTPDDADASST